MLKIVILDFLPPSLRRGYLTGGVEALGRHRSEATMVAPPEAVCADGGSLRLGHCAISITIPMFHHKGACV